MRGDVLLGLLIVITGGASGCGGPARESSSDGSVPVELCDTVADEDGDGLARCDDPDCALACDADGDGHVAELLGGDDCDDTRADVAPGLDEVCDGVDNDCDDAVDDQDSDREPDSAETWYPDADGDGYGDGSVTGVVQCTAVAGAVTNADDCDDRAPDVSPADVETCDERDEDCDGVADDGLPTDTWYPDADGDGHGAEGAVGVVACASPGAASLTADDCDDADAELAPSVLEVCNGIDDDCDGLVDDDDPGVDPASLSDWWPDGDGDGYGDPTTSVASCERPVGHVGNGEDCDDGDPAATRLVDWSLDGDGDGYGAGNGVVACSPPSPDHVSDADGIDCDDLDATVHPGAFEVCDDGVDQSCSGFDAACHALIPGPIPDAATFQAVGEAGVSWLGGAVAGAGDFDGDGVPDLVMGAAGTPVNGVNAGAAYVVSGGPLSGVFDVANASARILGPAAEDLVGADVAGVGDIDGDGLDDVLIGGYRVPAVPVPGRAYLVLGGTTGTLDATAAHAVLEGPNAGDGAGLRVAGPGDVNGDLVPDLLVSAPFDDRVYLVHGPVSGNVSLATADAVLQGPLPGEMAGLDLASAGDVNGDGIPDILVGTSRHDPAFAAGTGAVYLVQPPVVGTFDLSQSDAVLFGESGGDSAGDYLAEGADLDLDGYADIVVGAPLADANGALSGAAYLVHGPVTGALSLGLADARLAGAEPGDFLGPVSVAGDVDGDGWPDLVLGAYVADRGELDQGAAMLVYGPVLGDLDLAHADLTVIGGRAGDQIGASVAGVGDVDADGYDDVIIGSRNADRAGATDAGAVYLLYGAP